MYSPDLDDLCTKELVCVCINMLSCERIHAKIALGRGEWCLRFRLWSSTMGAQGSRVRFFCLQLLVLRFLGVEFAKLLLWGMGFETKVSVEDQGSHPAC